METFPVEKADEGTRIDQYLSVKLDGFTRNAVQRLAENGFVEVNGRTVEKSYRLKSGDVIAVCPPRPSPVNIRAQDIPLTIVYEDEDLLVVDKPKGMVVHPAPGNGDRTLVNALLFHCGDRLSGIGGQLRPGIVHRIDKDTSGLLVVAKNDRAHQGLQAQIQVHSMTRQYEAVVYGTLKADGTVHAPIARHPMERKKMAICHGGKDAVTHYRILRQYNGFCHIICNLETGRTHQIRVHMASIGHPVAGDIPYGPKKALTSLHGQCLHASSLGFSHPETGKYMEFKSDLPDYFVKFLKTLEGRTNL